MRATYVAEQEADDEQHRSFDKDAIGAHLSFFFYVDTQFYIPFNVPKLALNIANLSQQGGMSISYIEGFFD